MGGGHGKAGGAAVTTVAHQQFAHLVQRAANVKFGDAARTAARFLWPLFDHQGRAVETFGQPTGDQPDDAGTEVGTVDHIERCIITDLGGDLRFGLFLRRLGEVTPLLVERFEFAGQVISLHRVGGAQQLIGKLGMGQPPGGVDARGNAKTNRGGVNMPGRQIGPSKEFGQANPLGVV